MKKLEYSIAIATRNRLKALSLSIPRMLKQTRPPSQIVVVDSSDDHEPVRSLVHELTKHTDIPTTIVQSEKGLTRQRNRALELVEHPIVFFPDDDSIWFENTASLQMEVYERDTQNFISAVCGAESIVPPSDFNIKNTTYSMNLGDKLKLRVSRIVHWIENAMAPDPARIAGLSFFSNQTLPSWTNSETIIPVEWMTGFRMSFRTETIIKYRFDEILKDYSLCEDIDASFSAWKEGAVVGVRNSKIYHFKSPEKRGNGKTLGSTQILNKAYVVVKHTAKGHPARKALAKFAKLKILKYRLDAKDTFGKERYIAAKQALNQLSSLVECDKKDLAHSYHEGLKDILDK